MKRYIFAISWLVACLFSSQLLLAEERLSDIWVYYSEDDFDSKDTSLLVNFGISPKDSISMGFGESSSEYTVRLRDGRTRMADIITKSFNMSYNTIKYAPWSMSYAYGYWGKNNEIESNSLFLNADYFFEKWVTGFSLEYRNLDVYNTNPQASQQRVSIESYGLGVIVERDWQDFRWSIYGDWYDYDEDISNISTLELIQLIGLKNYTHSSILVDWSAGSSLRYLFGDSSLAFKYSHSVAEIRKTESDDFAMVFDTSFFNRFLLNLEWGRSYSNPSGSNPSGQKSESDYAVIGLGVKF